MIREGLRATGKLLHWSSPKATGVASKSSLRQNRFIIEALIPLWGQVSPTPKSPPIEWIRQEVLTLIVGCLQTAEPHTCKFMFGLPCWLVDLKAEVREIHRLLSPRQDAVNIYVDEWGIKRLVSRAIRRYRTGQDTFRDQACIMHVSVAMLCMFMYVMATFRAHLQDELLQPLMDMMILIWSTADGDAAAGADPHYPGPGGPDEDADEGRDDSASQEELSRALSAELSGEDPYLAVEEPTEPQGAEVANAVPSGTLGARGHNHGK